MYFSFILKMKMALFEILGVLRGARAKGVAMGLMV